MVRFRGIHYGSAVVTVEYNNATMTVTLTAIPDGTQLSMGSVPLVVGSPHTAPVAPFALAFAAA